VFRELGDEDRKWIIVGVLWGKVAPANIEMKKTNPQIIRTKKNKLILKTKIHEISI